MKLLETKDGSHTLYSKNFDEIYHSRHGAVTESQHVFIQNGLAAVSNAEIRILEVGFGTGLNAWLAWQFAEIGNRKIDYTGYELHPIEAEWFTQLNYASAHPDRFRKLHESPWDEPIILTHHFSFRKVHDSFLTAKIPYGFNVCFFDAFSPEKQPLMWELTVFQKIFDALHPGGILVTYCAKGYVRRNLQAAGFLVERLPGPPGKRQMLRAIKPTSFPTNK